jgi:hypothetical protein
MKTKAQVTEGIAFNWCKVATILALLWILQLERWALPIAAFTCAILFVVAHFQGTNESRCILKKPLLIAVFWSAIGALWLALHR